MTDYVTRAELRQELQTFGEKFEQKLEVLLAEKLAPWATKSDLEALGTALIARMERGEKAILRELAAMEQRLLDELARQRRR